MRLPWGGLETEAVGAWERLASAVRECPGTAIISHEILATASRSQVGRALASLGADDGPDSRGARRPLGARPGAPDPRRVAGERQAPQPAQLRAVPRAHPRPRAGDAASARGSGACRRSPTSSTAGARTCRPNASTWSPCRRPAPRRGCCGSASASAFGLDGIDLDLTAERANPSLGVPETALLRRINRAANRVLDAGRLSPAGPRAARPPDPVAAVDVAAAALPPTGTPGCTTSGARLGRGDRAPRLRRDRRGRRPGRRAASRGGVRRPRPPRAARWRGRRSTRSGLCCSRTARLRGEEARLAGELAEAAARRSSAAYLGRRTSCRERAGGCPPARTGRARLLRVYRRLRGQELAVGVAADLPRRVRVGAQPHHAADHRDLAARPSWPAACRRPS